MTARRLFQLSVFTGLAVAASVLAPTRAIAGSATTRYVDDDGRAGGARGCAGERRAHERVQPAVDASGQGDLILVCPGTYRGRITVRGHDRDGLRLRATQQWQSSILPPRGKGGNLITVKSDGVLVQGLDLVAPTSGDCARIYSMIVIRGSLDATIRANRMRPNGSDTIGPCGFNKGINLFGRSRVWIGDNVIRDFRDLAISRDPYDSISGSVEATIVRNRIRYFHAAEAPASDPSAVGIEIDGSALSASVIDNVIEGLPSAGTGSGATPLLTKGIYVGFGAWIRRNLVRHVSIGIATIECCGLRIIANVVRHSRGTGIDVGPLGAGMIRANRVYDSGGNGIEATETFGVTLRGNVALGSGGFDCVDTAGSSTWINNIGETSDPPGLCTPPGS